MEKIRKNEGITIITLIVTVVIMIILAGIAIGLSLGNSGIIKKTKEAKEQAEITEEKEIVKRAVRVAMIETEYESLEEKYLNQALKDEAGSKKTELTKAGQTEYEVLFVDTNRYYEINEKGTVGDAIKVTKDENAGDITKGGRCDGSKEKPYEINCIEDLVILANRTNGKGNYVDENGGIKDAVAVTNPFKGKNFVLTRTLNFESKFSYLKPELKWSYDSEKDTYKIDETSTTTLQEIITDKTGVGFVPISPDTGSSLKMFQGNLDGQGYEIRNLYENRATGNAGLFRTMCGSTIKNLKLKGNINAHENSVGCFSYRASGCKFYNCSNFVNISAGKAGGIASQVYSDITLINCYNKGNQIKFGGLISWDDVGGTTTIVNCYNAGLGSSAIIGDSYSKGTRNIINTCSIGEIKSR